MQRPDGHLDPADPDDPDDLGDGDDDLVEGSRWERLATEAVGPLRLELPDPDDAEVVAAWTIPAPDSDGVCELDQLANATDVVDALLGGGDLADDVLDHLEQLPFSATTRAARLLRAHWALDQDLPAGMWLDIIEQIDLYGDALERDLALGGPGYTGGIDLLDWFRGRRPWPQLLRLVAGLPPGSRYVAAVLDDEDLAAARLDAVDDEDDADTDTPARPGLEGETPDRALLRAAVSTLLRIEHATYAVHAGKKAGKPPRPLPGPETAEDRLRERIADREVEDLFDQATPGWRAGDDPAPPAGYHRHASGLLTPDT